MSIAAATVSKTNAWGVHASVKNPMNGWSTLEAIIFLPARVAGRIVPDVHVFALWEWFGRSTVDILVKKKLSSCTSTYIQYS